MKRHPSGACWAAAALLLVAFHLQAPLAVQADVGRGGQAQAPCTAENGDIDADGQINLTDAVTLLGRLFQGSPTALAPLCENPPPPTGLPATGQTQCYDAIGRGVFCDSQSCPGQDGTYLVGCSSGRFTDNGDGTVTDHCTGLMWQKDTADVNGDGRSNASDDISWCGALAFCESLSFGGYDDWRLPNARELASIVDWGRAKPAINPVFRVLTKGRTDAYGAFYWASTTLASRPEVAYRIGYYIGDVDFLGKGEADALGVKLYQYVRAVRSIVEVDPGQGGGGGSCAMENGDVNADGKMDLADAVTILGYLFQGSPKALPKSCLGPPATWGLPATGQTVCYDATGSEIPCDDEACPGQDGAYRTGCSPEDRFTDNGDGTVTDTCTGLMWQQDTADVNGDGEVSEDRVQGGDAPEWCEALAYCESLSFAGHDDWRLPNALELESIVDYARSAPAIDPVFGALGSYYWSSTSVAFLPPDACAVNFLHGGDTGLIDKVGRNWYVRAVRGGF